jgi:hypothetical protein
MVQRSVGWRAPRFMHSAGPLSTAAWSCASARGSISLMCGQSPAGTGCVLGMSGTARVFGPGGREHAGSTGRGPGDHPDLNSEQVLQDASRIIGPAAQIGVIVLLSGDFDLLSVAYKII